MVSRSRYDIRRLKGGVLSSRALFCQVVAYRATVDVVGDFTDDSARASSVAPELGSAPAECDAESRSSMRQL